MCTPANSPPSLYCFRPIAKLFKSCVCGTQLCFILTAFYAHLLQGSSSFCTNRAVAKWVKSWDPCVFGTGTGPSLQGQQQHGLQGRKGGSSNRGGSNKQGQAKGVASGDGRPEYKAILLTGPPGE